MKGAPPPPPPSSKLARKGTILIMNPLNAFEVELEDVDNNAHRDSDGDIPGPPVELNMNPKG
jgi:hypothetical protein